MDHFCYLCFVFVMLSCLFIAALWSPAGIGLTPLGFLVYDVLLCFRHFPIWGPGQVWYLIVLISDLCLLAYFVVWVQQFRNDSVSLN